MSRLVALPAPCRETFPAFVVAAVERSGLVGALDAIEGVAVVLEKWGDQAEVLGNHKGAAAHRCAALNVRRAAVFFVESHA